MPLIKKLKKKLPADVAILTGLQEERAAVWSQLSSAFPQSLAIYEGEGHTYYYAQTPKGLKILVASASEMGPIPSALLARDVIAAVNPKAIIMAGIAGGIGKNVDLGDIVVSTQVVDYEFAKVTDESTLPRWTVYQPNAGLLDRVQNFQDRSWSDSLFIPRPDKRPVSSSRIHFGVVLSGNKVLASEKASGQLAAVWSRATAIEMEGAGVACAIQRIPGAPAFILIKAVCDLASAQKDDAWQPFAAQASAALVVALLATLTPQAINGFTTAVFSNERKPSAARRPTVIASARPAPAKKRTSTKKASIVERPLPVLNKTAAIQLKRARQAKASLTLKASAERHFHKLGKIELVRPKKVGQAKKTQTGKKSPDLGAPKQGIGKARPSRKLDKKKIFVTKQTISSEKKAKKSTVGEKSLRRNLRKALCTFFSTPEIEILAFDLSVEVNEIRRPTHSETVIAFLLFIERRRRMEELITLIKEDRPDVIKAFEGFEESIPAVA